MAAKLTMNADAMKTPSQEIIDEANRVYSVTDARGRVIAFRRLKMSDQRRILKSISNEAASKEKYLGMIMVAACVTSIDGDEIRFPASELQFDALIDRLETEGFKALGGAMQQEFGIQTEEALRNEAGE